MKAENVDLEIYQKRPRERFTQARVIRALRRAAKQQNGAPLGLTTRAARRLSCAESTVRAYIRRYPAIRAVKEEIEEEWRVMVDAIVADMKASLRGRKISIEPDKLNGIMREMTASWNLNVKGLK